MDRSAASPSPRRIQSTDRAACMEDGRLTIDAGLRWEPFIPPHFFGAFNPISQIWPAAVASGQRSIVYPNAPAGLFFAGDPGVPKGGTAPVYTNFSPRLGFSYDISGKQSTVVRGAFGVFFDQPKLNGPRWTHGSARSGSLVPQVVHLIGRHDWIRTNDLYRVKVAL